jgi:primosomal protein N''
VLILVFTLTQVERLRMQNQQLTELLDNEKIQSAALKDDLIKQISALLLNFTTTHSRNIDSAMQPVLQQNLAGITHLRAFEERYVTKAQASRDQISRYELQVNGMQEEYQTLRQEGHKVRPKSIRDVSVC